VLTRLSGRASAMPAGETLAAFAATGATLAIHLAIHRLAEVVAVAEPFYGADCPVAVMVRVSWPDEQIIQGTLSNICEAVAEFGVERTALILIGQALAPEDFRESALYNPDYTRRFRT
jgi:precorrin-4/cobalt-precorrin-4 C11-methyltransferase